MKSDLPPSPLDFDPDASDLPRDDLVAVGGDFSVATLLIAYSKGLFPWPVGPYDLLWFYPVDRAVLFFEDFKVSRSTERDRKKAKLVYSIDQHFDDVIAKCADVPRPEGAGTWITSTINEAYRNLHRAGLAHSFEVSREGKLVGGVYGVSVRGAFAAESMFYEEKNTSKHALAFLVETLSARGLNWMDCQVLNPFTKSIGAKEISRKAFRALLRETQTLGLRIF